MTRQETLKRRIRLRMSTTGERYTAARRHLLSDTPTSTKRTWIAQPEMNDESVRSHTGRGWDEWCDLIDASPHRGGAHQPVAAYLLETYDELDGWWSQAVTVGYERITGLRLPFQRADGTFVAGKSKTVHADGEELRRLLVDDVLRSECFPGQTTVLKSKPEAKKLRIAFEDGIAEIAITGANANKNGERIKISIDHVGLAEFDDVARWKFFWTDWLEAVDTMTPSAGED